MPRPKKDSAMEALKSVENQPETVVETKSEPVLSNKDRRYNSEPQYLEVAAMLFSSIVKSISSNIYPPEIDDTYVIEGYRVFINIDKSEMSIYERRAGLRILYIKLNDAQVRAYIKAERDYLEHPITKSELTALVEVAKAAYKRTGFGDLMI